MCVSLPSLYPRHSLDLSQAYSVKKYIKLSENPQSISSVTGEQRQLAFQLWVAYDLYGRCKEDFAGQLRCPLIGCSTSFESLGLCLQHLPTCAWLSNSWYWCPLCQRPERFAEPGPTLAQPPKLESGPGTPKCATLLPQKSTVAKIWTTRFWKHLRNKSNLLSAHRILPMYRPCYEIDSVTSHRQSPPEYGGRFPWNSHAFHSVQSAAAGTSMQYPELEAVPYYRSNDAWLNQRQELESQSYSPNTWMAQTQRIELDSHPFGVNNLISSEPRPELDSSPTSQRSGLRGNQLWTEGWNETPELHSNEPVHQRLLQLPESVPFYTETEHVAPPYKYLSAGNGSQPVSSWAPTLPPEVIARSSIANSPLDYSSLAQHYEPPLPPVDSVPTRLTPARHEGLSNTFGFNDTPARQLTSFGQSSCQTSPFFDRSSQTGHGQARAMAKMESVEGQSIRKTIGRHNFPQPDPSAEYSDAVTRTSPRCSDEALLRTMATDNSITSIPYPSKEPLPALKSEDHLMANHTPEGPNQIVNPAGLKLPGREQCSKCRTEFNGSSQDRKHNMKRHLQFACPARAGPRKDFECSTHGCNKRYSRPDNLAKHCQKEHQGVPALQRSNAQTVGWKF